MCYRVKLSVLKNNDFYYAFVNHSISIQSQHTVAHLYISYFSLVNIYFQCGTELPFMQEEVQLFPDIVFSVKGHHFHCHKVRF